MSIIGACQSDDELIREPEAHNGNEPGFHERSEEKGNSSNGRYGPPRLWYFYRGETTSNLRYAYSDDGGSVWSGDQMFNNGIGSSTSPAVVHRFMDKFYAIYKGGSTNNIYFSTSTDGMNWQPNTQIPGISTAYAPTAVVSGNRIYVFFVANSLLIYYISSTDGINWTSARVVPYSNCNGAVTAVGGDQIVLFFNYPSPDGGYYLNFKTAAAGGEILSFPDTSDAVRNTAGKAIQTTTGVGALVGPDGYWYVAYKAIKDARLNVYRGGCLGGPWCGGGTVYWSGAYTSNGPSLDYTSYNEFLLVYKSLSSGAIQYGKSSNGTTWSSNHSAIGQTTNGGPRLVEEY